MLYLDLLAASLTGSLEAERWSLAMAPERRLRGPLWTTVERLLRRRGYALARRSSHAAREAGLDWPLAGETMVGVRRLRSLRACVETVLAERVPGDLLEAGVWRGGAAIFMKGVLAAHGDAERTVWLADSFMGLPKPDGSYPADQGSRLWAAPALAVSLDDVRANFERYGLLDERVRFLPGWFQDTLPTCPVGRLAVLRVDADLYESTTLALRSLYDRVAPGGFVIVDDYGALAACRAAVDEFRREAGVGEPLERVDASCVLWRREP